LILGKTPVYIHDFLRSKQVWFEGLLYQPASSSAKRARNARITGRQVAKAVLVRAGNSLLLAVLPASCRIDLDRLSQVVGSPVSEIRLATPEELLATFPDCEPGVVPPFGRLYGLPTLVDSRLSEIGEIVVSANTRHEGLRMHFRDFAAIEEPAQASFSQPISSGQRPSNPSKRDENRRAG
jgi:Ala-tRNA(Pro) deacylase